MRQCLVSFLFVVAIGFGAETEVYRSDFAGRQLADWNHSSVGTTPLGARKFLGPFGEQTKAHLSLDNLPSHRFVRVRITLFVMFGHDGNDAYFGPDTWGCRVQRGPELLHTTFCNVKHLSNLNEQTFPADIIDPENPVEPLEPAFPAGTGSAEFGTLGWVKSWGGNQQPVDSVYNLEFVFPHRDDALTLTFFSDLREDLRGESWGLERVNVDVFSEPVLPKDLSALWKTLLTGAPEASYAAVWEWVATGQAGIDWIQNELQPKGKSAAELRELVQALNADSYQDREAASKALWEKGPAIAAFLRTELATFRDVPEIKIRITELLREWTDRGEQIGQPSIRNRLLKVGRIANSIELKQLLDTNFPAMPAPELLKDD